MEIVNIMQLVATLSEREELQDDANKATLLFFINQAKLKEAREHRYRFCENTTPLSLKTGKRTVNIPKGYLHSEIIRRTSADIDVSGDTKQQFFDKYLSKSQFEIDYPEQDSSGNMNTGIANKYTLWAGNIHWGNVPNADEVVYCDYYRQLPDYDLITIKEDDFSIVAYDVLIRAALEEIFGSWIINYNASKFWSGKKIESIISLRKMQVLEEASFGHSLQMETYG